MHSSRADLLAQARLLHHLDAPASQPALRSHMLAELGIYEGDAAHLAQFEADEIEADPELQRFAALLDAHLGELVDDMAAAWPAAELEAARAAAAA